MPSPTTRGGSPARRQRPVPLCVLAVVVALVAGPAPAAADALDAARARGTLRWGGDVQGGEPYVFQHPEDSAKLLGFEVEIAEDLARRLGLRAEFVQNDWSTLIPSLERGDFDLILNGLEVTAARRGRIAFTRPYYAFTETLVVRRDDPVNSLEALRGQRVGTLSESLAADIVRAAGVDVVLYEGVEEPYIDLEHGRLRAVVLDNIIADRYGLVRSTLREAATVGAGTYAIGLRPDDTALLAALDEALAAMRDDGTLRAILDRWNLWTGMQEGIAADEPHASPPPARSGLTPTHIALFLRGAGFTVLISTLAMLLAVGGGLLLAVSRRYGGPVLGGVATVYIEFMRGTPLLLQLYVLYYGLAPVLALHPLAAAILGLGLNYAAYEAELYRAGIQAVPAGQTEAALSLGMSRALTFRRIIFPQALRVALPGMTNDFIALLKDSSLVSVITVVELTKQMTITAVDVRGWLLPGLLCAALYLLMSYPLSRLARRLERRLAPVSA